MVIYQIIHIPSGKFYIGCTKDVERRFRSHRKRSTNSHLKSLIAKYGESEFLFEVIDKADCIKSMRKLEQDYLDEFFNHPLCINHCSDSRGNFNPTEDWRKAIGEGKLKWREENPELSRAISIENGALDKMHKWMKDNPEEHAKRTSEGAKKGWANLDEEGKQNRLKHLQEANKERSVKILVYKVDGSFVGEFPSIRECGRQIPDICGKGARLVLKGKYKQSKGYVFKYG